MRVNLGRWAFFLCLAVPVWSWRVGKVYNRGYAFCYDAGPFVLMGFNYLND